MTGARYHALSLASLVAVAGLVPVGVSASSLTPLGFSHASGISDDGQIIVGYQLTGAHQDAVYWAGGGEVTPLVSPIRDNAFNGISGDGSTVVGYNSINGKLSPIAYQADVVIDLPLLSFVSPDNTYATAANGNGSIIAGFGPDSLGHDRGIVWSGANWGVVTVIEPTDNSGSTSVYGISGSTDHPIVVGEDVDGAFNRVAYAWQDGLLTDLASGGLQSGAYAISADGSTIAGYILTDATHGDAAIWSGPGHSTLTNIGTLGGDVAFGTAVNADGSVVVGRSFLATNSVHAFRYADGHIDDLNTLLSDAGVNLAGIELTDATGLSADGKYIAANSAGAAYLVYYGNGVGGVANQQDQQASVDALGRERQAVVNTSELYFGILDGDTDRHDDTSTAGVFGAAGSAVAGARGKWSADNGFTFSGGLADGTTEAGDANIRNALFGAVSVRYDSDVFNVGGFRPFMQAGVGEALLLDLSTNRPYASGSGTGTISGSLTSAYLRAGVTGDFDNGDQASFSGELDSSWLSTGAYNEAVSAHNMFPASIAAGSDQSTAVRASATWSHRLTEDVDMTLQAGLSADISGRSGLRVQTTGFGTLAGGYAPAMWTDTSAHLNWSIGDKSTLDVFAAGNLGGPQGNHAHIGVGYHISE